MCGIAGGVLINHPFNKKVLDKMISVIKHRGPDDSGSYINGGVGLGFRRLSIIDLSSAGHQPMAVHDGDFWIVFNGEIYNFELLRKELEAEGARFNSSTDTEVILRLYCKYGVKCFNRLRGMFAIAIWDNRQNQLILARDRVGKKPLYYYQDEEKFLFASELKSIYQFPGINYEINNEALSEYFTYGFIGSPRTIYQSVFKLEPGCYLTINKSGAKAITKYWDWVPPVTSQTLSFEEAKQKVFDKVDESICLRMRSDVPLGAFLSGGIDSTIVVARMAEHSVNPVKTFTIGFKDKAFDESEYAAIVADRYQTEHHLEIVDPDYAELIEKIISNFDEPFGDSSALPTYVVSEMISKHVTVALSGDGGDEVFGGYEIYQESLANRKFDRGPSWIKYPVKMLDSIYPETLPGRNFLRRVALSDPYERFIERYKLINDAERRKLLPGNDFAASIFKKDYFDQLVQGTDFLSSLQYNDIKHYLEGDILVKVDRTTMLHSIESRAPLLDHELIELAFTLPPSFLINKGQKKFILKEAFKNYIPASLLSRPKKGFSVPLVKWFKNELKEYFESMVFTIELENSAIINLSYVKRLLNIHLSGRRDLSFHLWLILSFSIWYHKVHLQMNKSITNAENEFKEAAKVL